MSQFTDSIYQEYVPERSHPSTRQNHYNMPMGIARQPSRNFEIQAPFPPQQRLYTADDHQHAQHPQYDTSPRFGAPSYNTYNAQTWNGYQGPESQLGGTTSRTQSTRRARISSNFYDPPTAMPPPPMPSFTANMNGQYAPPMQNMPSQSPPPDDELIPTAIVIKNIPFAVKKETLSQMMCDMGLPLPYAFNYHFDAGIFRGLAFANFNNGNETARVIEAMNGLDLQGRKLRVEYKKMLPQGERDRIEREKRERRGQLQEQHQPMGNSQLHNQGSMTSLNSNLPATSPSPVSQRMPLGNAEYDLNDPITLGFHNKLLIFSGDPERQVLIFPNTVTPSQRKIIHTLAHHMGLYHESEGVGDNRQVLIYHQRSQAINTPAPQLHFSNNGNWDSQRRVLNRAATTDFGADRESSYFTGSGRQNSGLLEPTGSPGAGSGLNAHNLRAAKSFADLRSYTPSPVPSTASFPAGLSLNVSRFVDNYSNSHNAGISGTPKNITPTSATGMSNRDEQFINSMSSMSLGGRSNARLNQDHNPSAGAIGSHRPVNGNNYDDTVRNGASAVPERQPRGPGSEWGGFSRRQNGHVNRGSDSSDRSGPLPSSSRYM